MNTPLGAGFGRAWVSPRAAKDGQKVTWLEAAKSSHWIIQIYVPHKLPLLAESRMGSRRNMSWTRARSTATVELLAEETHGHPLHAQGEKVSH